MVILETSYIACFFYGFHKKNLNMQFIKNLCNIYTFSFAMHCTIKYKTVDQLFIERLKKI